MEKKVTTLFLRKIIFIFLLLVLSCTKETSTQNNTNNSQVVIIPLSVGNNWTYKQTRFDSSGVETYSYNFTANVYRDTILGNEKWYRLGDGTYACNRNDGYWVLSSEYIEILKYDLQSLLNHTWLEWAYPSFNGNKYSFITSPNIITINSTDTEISVPAGKFICYEYEYYPGGSVPAKSYYAPNIGLIRTDYFSLIPKSSKVYMKTRNELVSYHLE